MAEIYIVRHGITESNKKRIYMGRSQEGLAPEGIAQAENLGKSLLHLGIKRIYSSPMYRALETASIIANTLKVPVEIKRDLAEMELGIWAGLTEEEVSKKFPEDYRQWNTIPQDFVLAGREPLITVQQRALKAMAHIKERNGESPALAVTHVAIVRCLILYYQGLNLNVYRTIPVPNVSVFRLQIDGDFGRISRFL